MDGNSGYKRAKERKCKTGQTKRVQGGMSRLERKLREKMCGCCDSGEAAAAARGEAKHSAGKRDDKD